MSSIAHVGIDWHEATLRVVGLDDESKLVIDKTVLNDAKSIKRQFKELSKKYTLRCCYEAGAGGYVLYRLLTELKIDCSVIAPSLVPTCAGDRIKTDRRDAIKLARGQKNGDLVRVYTPTTAQERDRRLTRSRASTVKSVTRIKNEILKLLTSVGVKRPYRSTWTGQHLEWLRNLSLEGSDGLMLKDLLSRFDFQSAQLVVINGRIEELSKTDPYREYAGTLMCLKGIALVSSMVLLTEIIDFNRFGSPRQLMAYLGLIPSEESSGDKRRQGAITKCGNARCRHILVEAGWKYKNKPNISSDLKERQLNQDAAVVAHSWKAQQRLYKKYWGIANRKEKSKAAVAVTRELVGFIWAIMTGNFGPAAEEPAEATVLNSDQANEHNAVSPRLRPASASGSHEGQRIGNVLDLCAAIKLLDGADPRVVEQLKESLKTGNSAAPVAATATKRHMTVQ